MECAMWNLTIKGIDFIILGIYRPPYNINSKITDNQAVDELLELLNLTIHKYNNLFILGDLNFHWNDQENPLIQVLKDSIYALDAILGTC